MTARMAAIEKGVSTGSQGIDLSVQRHSADVAIARARFECWQQDWEVRRKAIDGALAALKRQLTLRLAVT